jgi:LPS-assembly lipoprotein
MSMLRIAPNILCLASALFLFACGFHPIYGTEDVDKSVVATLNQVAVDGIPDHEGQMLRNELIDRMYGKGRPKNPKYHLVVSLRETEEGIGLLPNAITTLTELTVTADYSLNDESGKQIMKATARTVANYNQLQEQYGTLAAREGAYQRSLTEIADQIVNRVSLYFSEGNTIVPATPSTPIPIPGLIPITPP